MNKPNTTCRVCGKEYFCCGDSKAVNSWRAMACSTDCFKEYMKRIEEARNPKLVEEAITEARTETVVKKYNKKKEIKENEFGIDIED